MGLLDERAGRDRSVFQLHRWLRALRRRYRARRWLVCLCALNLSRIFRGTQHRLLDRWPPDQRLWQHCDCLERDDDDSVHALPRHEAKPLAATCLDELGDGSAGVGGDRAANCCSTHVASRPLSGWSLLRYPSWRLGGYLDALLLDFWSSGSLHPGLAGIRYRLRGDPSLLTQADLRLLDHGSSDG